ncbi:transposase [Gemmatimonas sp.]|uniref:transposase n=1 Tax=Gemmatimonas sp. TaxID=1962908 RepID=UPI003F7198A1
MGATIYSGDEMGLRSDHVTGTNYAPVDQTPVVRATGQQFGCSCGRLVFHVFHGTFRAPTFVDVIRRRRQQAGSKPAASRQQGLSHRRRASGASFACREGLWRRPRRRQPLDSLPGYCPELNPEERPNQDVETNALGKRRPQNRADMMTAVRLP